MNEEEKEYKDGGYNSSDQVVEVLKSTMNHSVKRMSSKYLMKIKQWNWKYNMNIKTSISTTMEREI
jgi:hypothetical protein